MNPSPRGLALLALLTVFAPSCSSVDERTDVAYDARYGDATTMDVYLPPGGTGLRAGVLFIHGGSWQFGKKADFASEATRLARSGYVAASINYRLAPDNVFPKAIQDAECALSFFQAHAAEYRMDPKRIVVVGYSAGGHLASLLGVALDDPKLATDCPTGVPAPAAGIVSGDGPQDMRVLGGGPIVSDFLGGSASDVPEVYDEASPITHVKPGAPPFLLVHGAIDWVVNLEAASRMRDALAAAGNDVRFLKLAGGGHVVNPSPNGDTLDVANTLSTPEAWIAVDDFLARTVGAP